MGDWHARRSLRALLLLLFFFFPPFTLRCPLFTFLVLLSLLLHLHIFHTHCRCRCFFFLHTRRHNHHDNVVMTPASVTPAGNTKSFPCMFAPIVAKIVQ